MPRLYFILAGVHVAAVAVTGMLWTYITLVPGAGLKRNFRDIRAVHFGSLYLAPWFLGLAYALERLHVPPAYWLGFPLGLGTLLVFAGVAYLFPRRPGLDPFYYWTEGKAMWLSLVGLAGASAGLFWTAGVLVAYAWPR